VSRLGAVPLSVLSSKQTLYLRSFHPPTMPTQCSATRRINLHRAQVNKSSGLRFRTTISAGDHGGGAARLWGIRRAGRVALTNARRPTERSRLPSERSLSLSLPLCVPPMTARLSGARPFFYPPRPSFPCLPRERAPFACLCACAALPPQRVARLAALAL